ncbi:MAG: short-chain dehydrogenase [Solirubrobacterales bacterium]|jgi:3-oxoacyl-[acyl-carrier protein] reductase|nr:short-chain dehydrogenase [Solirubrobacterales bacterium]
MNGQTLPWGAAIVTGASRGLGAGIARRLAATGRPVVLAARDAQALEAEVSAIHLRGGEALAIVTDVADPESVERMVATAYGRFDAIGMVVNNAGAPPLVSTLDAMTWDEWRRNIDVDVRGAFNVTRAVAPHLRGHGTATLVNVAAGAVAAASPGHVSFSPAQAALVSFSRCVGSWLAPSGVAVHCLCPDLTPAGGVGLAAATAFGASQGLSAAEWLERRFDDARLMPEDVGDAVIELAAHRDGAEWWLTAGDLVRWNVLQEQPPIAVSG